MGCFKPAGSLCRRVFGLEGHNPLGRKELPDSVVMVRDSWAHDPIYSVYTDFWIIEALRAHVMGRWALE